MNSGEILTGSDEMEWKPITAYDMLKTKPKPYAVFLVAEYRDKRNHLPQTVSLERRMGFRTITHFCVLPEFPDEGGVPVV